LKYPSSTQNGPFLDIPSFGIWWTLASNKLTGLSKMVKDYQISFTQMIDQNWSLVRPTVKVSWPVIQRRVSC